MEHYPINEHPIWEIWERLYDECERHHCEVDGKELEVCLFLGNPTHKGISVGYRKNDVYNTEILRFYPNELKIEYVKSMNDKSLILPETLPLSFRWEWIGSDKYYNTIAERMMDKLCDILKDTKSRSEIMEGLKARI